MKKMNHNISFQDRAKIATELLSKQEPVSFEEMRIQIQWLKENCPAKNKKQKKTGELILLVQNKNVNTEIRNIISGESTVTNGIIQAAAAYAGGKATADKKSEMQRLEDYISGNDLWVNLEQIGPYLTEGVEQKVYRCDANSVIKLNTSVYYSSWQSYLHSLLLNNYFFPETAYELIGFIRRNDELNAVVKQHFVKATEATDLELVKRFMAANGFVNTKNNDYRNDKLGIILEDLHDENVLTNKGVLQFVDTVFYLIKGIGG
jgi:hypothetical protein